MRKTIIAAVMLATACSGAPEPTEHKQSAATKVAKSADVEGLQELCTTDDVEVPSAELRWGEAKDGRLPIDVINPSEAPATMRVRATLARTKTLFDRTVLVAGGESQRFELDLSPHLASLRDAQFAAQIWVTADVTTDDRYLGTASAKPRSALFEGGRLAVVDDATLRTRHAGGDLQRRFFADVEPRAIGGASTAFVATKADLFGDPTDSASYEAEVIR